MDFRLQSASPLENTSSEWRLPWFLSDGEGSCSFERRRKGRAEEYGRAHHNMLHSAISVSSLDNHRRFVRKCASKARSGMKVSFFVDVAPQCIIYTYLEPLTMLSHNRPISVGGNLVELEGRTMGLLLA